MHNMLLPVVMEHNGKRSLLRLEGKKGLVYTEESRKDGDFTEMLHMEERNIVGFDCLVTESNALYVVLIDADNVFFAYKLTQKHWLTLFEPYRVTGKVVSFSIASDVKNQPHIFCSISDQSQVKLSHYEVGSPSLQEVSVLETGSHGDYSQIKSVHDLWGSFNLFYVKKENGVKILKHRYFVPFNKEWSPPTTLYSPEEGEMDSFTTIIDRQNNLYLSLLQRGTNSYLLIYLKRELGGWPRGGWQRPLLISHEEIPGIPVIELYQKSHIQVMLYTESELVLFIWKDGDLQTMQKKKIPADGKKLHRFRSTLPGKTAYILGDAPHKVMAAPPPKDEKEENNKSKSGVCEGEEVGEDWDHIPEEDIEETEVDNVFVRQAVQIMQAKTELEDKLARREKEITRLRAQYDSKVGLLKDQLKSRLEAFRSLESKYSRQEVTTLGLRSERDSLKKEVANLKGVNEKCQQKLQVAEKEKRELQIKYDEVKSRVIAKEKESQNQGKEKGLLEKIGGVFRK